MPDCWTNLYSYLKSIKGLIKFPDCLTNFVLNFYDILHISIVVYKQMWRKVKKYIWD